MIRYISDVFKRWRGDEQGLAAVEAAMVFPVMLTMLMGIFDIGNAILANQKTIRASQVVADLITRQNIVTQADVNEAIDAGRLALEPLDSTSFGIDVVSIRFDEDASTEILWRDTVNMSNIPDAIASVAALQEENEGVVMVTARYEYEPLFAGFLVNSFEMNEVAFSRGRSSPTITKDTSG